MHTLAALESLATALERPQTIWTNLSPSTAEERSRLYENRRRNWQRYIFGRIATLQILQHLEQCDSLTELLNNTTLEQEAAEAFAVVETSEENAPHVEDLLAKTNEKFKGCIAVCEKVTAKNKELIERTQRLMQAAIAAEKTDQAEWEVVSKRFKTEQEEVLEEINANEENISRVETEQGRPIIEEMQKALKKIQEAKNRRMLFTQKEEKLVAILADAHGIVAGDPPHRDAMSDYLALEETTMARYYELVKKKASPVVNVDFEMVSSQECFVIISLKYDWLKTINGRDDQARLKSIKIEYNSASARPTNIALKVDLSAVPSDHLDQLKEYLFVKISEWKNRALQSTSVDFHPVFQLFLQQPLS